ncbi:MAG: hypothetical protein R3B70_28075 [Polyangiaceae bacterium]
MTGLVVTFQTMSGPFDKELEAIANQHTLDFARKLAHEVSNLILRKLGLPQGAAASRAAAASNGRPSKKKPGSKPGSASAKSGAGAAKKVASAAQKKRVDGEDRKIIAEKVFRVVSTREGVAVADIVKATSLDRGPVAAALKSLKEEGRIYMGGSRRFARYAMSQEAANQASEVARKG